MAANITIQCPTCGKQGKMPTEYEGRMVACRQCSAKFRAVAMSKNANSNSGTAAARSVGADGVPLEWKVGDTILNLYAVNHVFTSGGMGLVYLVHHQSWNVDLAVKSPRAQFFQTETHKQNFVAEAQTWVNLGMHPHIASCFYVRTLGGIPRVFAEYIEGGSLADWIKSRKLYEGGQQAALERILDIAIQFAWGLHYAHEQGLVHQDVKPANVLMTKDGTAKVSDFGLAKARAATGETQTMNVSGTTMVTTGGLTPAYASPEQAERTKLTRRTDIWSWAVSVLEMFTGELTWMSGSAAGDALDAYLEESESSNSLPAMPKDLAALLHRCFENDPAERPTTMQVVADELRGVYESVVGKEYLRPTPQPAKAMADALNNKAVSLVDLGRREEAKHVLEQALKVQAGHQMARYNLALLNWVSGKGTDEDVIEVADKEQRSTFEKIQKDFLVGQAPIELKEIGYSCVMTLPHHTNNVIFNADNVLVPAHSRYVDNKSIESGLWSMSNDRKWGITRMLTEWSLLKDSELFLQLRDLRTEQCVQSFKAPRREYASSYVGAVYCRFSHKSDMFLHAQPKGQAQLWDISNQRKHRIFKTKFKEVASVGFSPDDRLVVIGAESGVMQVFDIEKGRLIQSLEGHAEGISDAIFAGEYVVSEAHDNTLRLWDVSSGLCLHTIIAKEVSCPLQASPNGRWVLVSNRRLWNTYPIYPRLPLAISKPESSQEIAKRDHVAMEALKEAAKATEAKQYQKAVKILSRARSIPGFDREPRLVETLARIGNQGERCDVNDIWQQHLLSGPNDAQDIIHIEFDKDTKNISGYGKDQMLYVWNVRTGELVGSHAYGELPKHSRPNNGDKEPQSSYSADKKWFAMRERGQVFLCKASLKSPVFIIPNVGGIMKGVVGEMYHHQRSDEIVSFSPDYNWLACNSYNGKVQLWRIDWEYKFS